MKKVDWKQRAKIWQERAKKAQKIVKIAVEVEHAYHNKGLTFTNPTAINLAQRGFENRMEELQWVLRNEGGLKR
jgi:hypothetical protein